MEARGGSSSEWIVRESVERLRPGGRVVLYTGTPVVEGEDLLRTALHPVLESRFSWYEYREPDPDVWGEELVRWSLCGAVGEGSVTAGSVHQYLSQRERR